MPLTPGELGRGRAEKDAPPIKALIDEIDSAMLAHNGRGEFIWIRPPMSRTVAEAVIAAYECAGWIVKIVDDQREHYWEFTPKDGGSAEAYYRK